MEELYGVIETIKAMMSIDRDVNDEKIILVFRDPNSGEMVIDDTIIFKMSVYEIIEEFRKNTKFYHIFF